jgi:hypothetical protein
LFEVGDAKAALENYPAAAQSRAAQPADLPSAGVRGIAPTLAGQGMNE